jgi:prephenate dehydrogenase
MGAPGGSAPFGRVGIVGVGLIGGSIAHALRAVWPEVAITGVDHPEVLAEAAALGIVDTCGRSLDDVADVDLIVLATPLPGILDLMPAVARLGTRAVITDVGSTKRHILRAAADADVFSFIGGHPVAGAERPGLEHARADLFNDQPWAVVPGSSAHEHAVARLEQFVVHGMGAVPHRLDADTHDRAMAYVSHLPQLLAVALMNTAGGAIGGAGLALSGRAFGEMTRLASSPADLWEGILATNADFVAEAAVALAAELPTDAARLRVTQWIEETFHQSGEWRNRLVHMRSSDNR